MKGRIIGLAAAVVIGLVAVGVILFMSDGAEEPGGKTGMFTPVNRDLSTTARDVLRAVSDWQEANPASTEEGGEPAAAAAPASTEPLDLTVVLREKGVDELPDDLTIAVCTDLKAWLDLQASKAFVPLVAARSRTALGGDVVLYDGQSITTVPMAKAPAWAVGGAAGAVELTKADLAGSEKVMTFKR